MVMLEWYVEDAHWYGADLEVIHAKVPGAWLVCIRSRKIVGGLGLRFFADPRNEWDLPWINFQRDLFVRFFLACAQFHSAPRISKSSFDTLNTIRTALSNRSEPVLPGIFGAGDGFIQAPVFLLHNR